MKQLSMDNTNFLSEFKDPVRQILIAQIVKSQAYLRLERPNFYALWFADIEMLVKWSSSDEEAMFFRGIDLTQQIPLFDVPTLWADEEQTDRAVDTVAIQPEFPSDHGQTKAEFDPQLTKTINSQTMARDRNTCVLTARQERTVETVHIIPGSIHGQISDHVFYEIAWWRLECFWSGDKVQRWKSQLEEGGLINTEKVFNLMTLDAQVKEYWDKGHIAFRPIRINREETEIQIAFYWLPHKESLGEIWRDDAMPLEDNSFEGPDYEGDQHKGPETAEAIVHAETGKNIRSGHIFTVRTDDKEHRPLPSFELLEMRWHLSRIAAMKGYEPPPDRYDEESNDSDREAGCTCTCHRQ